MSRNVSPYFGVSTQAITQATSGHLATVLSFPMSSQLLTTYESSLVVSILVRRKTKVKAGLGGYATRGVSAFPFSRVSSESLSRALIFCPPHHSRRSRGYSQCWTVTLPLASLADHTIAFYFNKFTILCVMCNYLPDRIRKKKLSKIT